MEDELYLENIDEFVTDQNRIVTYKWLSYTLGVHVNQAKQMLYDYVEKKRKENSGAQLHVTYLLAGNLIQNGHVCHKVAVVKEDKLEAMKSKLSTVASVHVYSIQKAMLKDSGPLYNTDYDIIKANFQNCSKFSAIHCVDAVARTADEISRLETPVQANAQPLNGVNSVAVPVVNGRTSSTSAKQASQQAKGIMGMFAAKSRDTHKEAKVETKEVPSASTASSKAPAKGNMLDNFFGKAAMGENCKLLYCIVFPKSLRQVTRAWWSLRPCSVHADGQDSIFLYDALSPPFIATIKFMYHSFLIYAHMRVVSSNEVHAEPELQKEEKSGAKSPVEPKSPGTTGLEKPGKKVEPAKVLQKDKKRVRRSELSGDEAARESESLKKKKRRIKPPQSDSSEEEDTPASPVTPGVEDLPPEPALKPHSDPVPLEASAGGKKRKRKRVLKSKTFVDEEGCMVTEKVYESESCTDSEDDFRSKPPAVPRPSAGVAKREPKEERKGTRKGPTALSKANKQASIMGFFQKK
ncbi:hypothetical protein lerEdw1_005738 [Lerista edwardsae]|nr:hypothetical protein lerEdw1_005738 [Lerista edwardsae]